jgi:hypothetical protein
MIFTSLQLLFRKRELLFLSDLQVNLNTIWMNKMVTLSGNEQLQNICKTNHRVICAATNKQNVDNKNQTDFFGSDFYLLSL